MFGYFFTCFLYLTIEFQFLHLHRVCIFVYGLEYGLFSYVQLSCDPVVKMDNLNFYAFFQTIVRQSLPHPLSVRIYRTTTLIFEVPLVTRVWLEIMFTYTENRRYLVKILIQDLNEGTLIFYCLYTRK